MRPIKFRGRSLETGEVIFSEIVDYGSDFAKIGYWVRAYGAWELRWENVDPDSVAQLVGYDKNSNEVYEGDTIIEEYVDGECTENIARLESLTQVPETAQFYFFPFPAPFITLKEKSA